MSNGPQFKTGFLAPLPDYGAIGREAAGRFINPILGVVQERAQRQLDKEKMLGIGTAGVTTAPGNINPYYKEGVQKALDVWQQTELDFKQNPSDANAQRVSAAKSQYSSIAQDAVFGSKFILEQNLSIRGDQDLAEAGLRDFNLNLFNQKFGQAPTYEVVGDKVRVVQGDQSVDYFDSAVTASNPDNLPVVQGSVEGAYSQLSSKVSDTIFVDSYQGRDTAGVSSGVLVDQNAFATDFADKYNGYAKREGTMWNAVALEAYKTKNIPNRGVVEKDLDAVDQIYSPSLKDLNVEGRSITKITGFDADGNPQYDVSEDELKTLVGTEMTTAGGRSFTVTEDNLMKFREAESLHAKNAYERAKSRLSVPEVTTTTTETGAAFIPFAPRNYGENNTVQPVEVEEVGQVLDIPTSARLNAVEVENTAVQVENVYMNPEGQVVAYKIGRNRDLLDKLLALPADQRSEAQQNLIDLLQSGAETITRDDNVELFTELQGQLSRMAAKNKQNPSYSDLIRLGQLQLGAVGTGTTPAPTPTPTAAQTALGGLNQGVGAEDPEEGQNGLAVPATVGTAAATQEPLEITPQGEVVATTEGEDRDKAFLEQQRAELPELLDIGYAGQSKKIREEAEAQERQRLQTKEQQLTVEKAETKAFWSSVREKTDGGKKFWGTKFANEEELFSGDGVNTITNQETLRQAIEEFGNPPKNSLYYDLAKKDDLLRGLTDETIREMYMTRIAKNEGYTPELPINVPIVGRTEAQKAKSKSGVTIAGLDIGRSAGDAERKIEIIGKYVKNEESIDALKALSGLIGSKAKKALEEYTGEGGPLSAEVLSLTQEDLNNITADYGEKSYQAFVRKVGNEQKLRDLPRDVVESMLDVEFNVPGSVKKSGKGRPLPLLKALLKQEEIRKADVLELATKYDDYYDKDTVTSTQILGRAEAAAEALRRYAETL